MQCGVVLTSVQHLDQLDACVRRGGYTAVKVVTGWGVAGGWNAQAMRRVLAMVPHVIVRTVTGDPSLDPLGKSDGYFVDPNRTVAEIAPWYQCQPNLIIELGNEPNSKPRDQGDIYRWVYNLKETITRCRATFPAAQLIAPALIIDRPDAGMYLDLGKEQLNRCDFIGAHIYEHYGWYGSYPASTGQYAAVQTSYRAHGLTKPWYVTELGINDRGTSPAEKGRRYAEFVTRADPQIAGVVYYHLELAGAVDLNYQIAPTGDLGFHRAYYP